MRFRADENPVNPPPNPALQRRRDPSTIEGMSYRFFKRLVGESSLEFKCLVLFGAALLLLITGSFWWYGLVTEKLVFEQNEIKGRLLVGTVLTRTHWEKLQNDPLNRNLAGILSSELTLPDYDWKFLKPEEADGASELVDDWERGLIARLRDRPQTQPTIPPKTDDPASVSDAHGERFSDSAEVYEYYEGIYASEQTCVNCHRANKIGGPDLAVGNLMAVAKISIPNGPTKDALNLNRAILIATGLTTVFLAILSVYFIVRYIIIKPVKHLRNVSDAVSRGDYEERAEINTGDEFEHLAVAFNRMLRHLVETQQELRHANSTLDVKVDELAQANMQLFESNRLKSDFLATMSHELRTPLNSIIGFSDVLNSIQSLDDRQKRYVQNIQKSGRVLLDMINDILDLAKIESGKMALRPSEFRIDRAIAAQVDMARPLAERKNIDVNVEIEPDLPELFQDQNKVQQILNNLLSNAIKFTPEGGRITVAARRDDQIDRLLLTVSDTGVGIAEDEQQAIFEKFRQGKVAVPGMDAMTREHSGTGLGLSIVKELCRLLGGEVLLHSELGKGSTFTVLLDWTLPNIPSDFSPTDSRRDFVTPLPATT
jgi:signal transduction histidine kinase